jgi:hypothetical protein
MELTFILLPLSLCPMNYNVLYYPSKQLVRDLHIILYNANDALTSVLVYQNTLTPLFFFKRKC